MDIREFKTLSAAEQLQVVWLDGKHVTERTDYTLTYSLYSVFSFYVEVRFNLRNNQLDRIAAFKNSSALDPYLDIITIDI